MVYRISGIVTAIDGERAGLQEISFRVAGGELRRAVVYTELTGAVAVGDVVWLNTVAVELGLGTGGLDFVVTGNLSERDAPGHLLKLRYTPLQTPVLAVEAPESPHHAPLAAFESLDGLPVVCMELHSQLPAVCVGARFAFLRRFGRLPILTYIMTDGAALPLAFSRLVSQLRERDLLQAAITAGQAFGGDYEAINVYSALAAAKVVCAADIVLVGQGPGNAGTGTPLGFSGIDAGAALNAVASLGGTAVFAPRIGFGDLRERHQGLSHHSATILTQIALNPALVPLPRLPATDYQRILQDYFASGIFDRHCVAGVDAAAALTELQALNLDLTTMGRTIEAEPAFFLAAIAAGILAAQCLPSSLPNPGEKGESAVSAPSPKFGRGSGNG